MLRIIDQIDHTLRALLAAMFAGLIFVVAFQVTARNLLFISASWTIECAQLLFSWCIFLGAGLAFRYRQHYIVDLWPAESRFAPLIKVFNYVTTFVVVYVLIWHGAIMSNTGLNRLSLGLGISEFWFYLPIPICGSIIMLFLIEDLFKDVLK